MKTYSLWSFLLYGIVLYRWAIEEDAHGFLRLFATLLSVVSIVVLLALMLFRSSNRRRYAIYLLLIILSCISFYSYRGSKLYKKKHLELDLRK